jgi:hypothetical protein
MLDRAIALNLESANLSYQNARRDLASTVREFFPIGTRVSVLVQPLDSDSKKAITGTVTAHDPERPSRVFYHAAGKERCFCAVDDSCDVTVLSSSKKLSRRQPRAQQPMADMSVSAIRMFRDFRNNKIVQEVRASN